MFTLSSALKSVVELFDTQTDRDESFLAEAVDLGDLERRMRVLDERSRQPALNDALGLYSR